MSLIYRIFSYGRALRFYTPQYMIFTFLGIMFGMFGFVMVIPLLNVIFDLVDPSELAMYKEAPSFSLDADFFKHYYYYNFLKYSDESNKLSSLVFVCVALIIANFMGNLFRYIGSVFSAKIVAGHVRDLRNAIYSKFNKLDLGFFTSEKKGDLMSRITNDVQEVERSMVAVLQAVVKEPIALIVYFGVLFYMQPKLTILSLVILPVAGGIISTITKKLRKSALMNQKAIGSILNIVEESLGGMRIIKAFTASSYMINKFEEEDRQYARINVSMAKKYNLAHPLSEFFGIITVAGLMFIGGNIVLNEGTMQGAEFIGFLVIFTQVLNPAKEISKAISAIARGNASAERIFELIDAEVKIVDAESAHDLEKFESHVAFENVSFAYDKDAPVLENINFRLEKGKTIALVGPSGGGKSTLADLIPRFYDPSDGRLLIDGMDYKEIKITSLREKMGIVTQESILFNDTVLKNIAFGETEIDEEKVIESAKVANAHEFIEKMENGYQTVIGERGMRLSGGQRQRLSIARAVYKNPPILILDEATSALDSESEKLVQHALTNLMQNRTSIVIAHRLSTIQHADEILVIKKGQICERGNHQELMELNGVYKKLIQMQSL